MDKPTPKREVAIRFTNRPTDTFSGGEIVFHATNDAVTEFEDFGTLAHYAGISGGYHLWVNPCYDFDEVLAYIENYG